VSLAGLRDVPDTTARLVEHGLSPAAAGEKAHLLASSASVLVAAGRDARAGGIAFFVPGRIEVLGKHTDYAGGRSLLTATERGHVFVAVPRDDETICMIDAVGGEQVAFPLGSPPRNGPDRSWAVYPATVGRRLARNFPGSWRGADIAFAGDLPAAAGLSSSTVLITGTALALAAANRLEERDDYRRILDSPEALAGYLGAVENGASFGELEGEAGVGTRGGSEDSTAMLCCRAAAVSRYRFAPIRREAEIPLMPGWRFAVAVSGVVAKKTGDARDRYNRAARLAAAAAAEWRRATGSDDPHLGAAVRSVGDAEVVRAVLRESRHEEFTAAELVRRFDHFEAESERIIPAAGASLEEWRLGAFGRHVRESIALGAKWLHNQVPETLFLANDALDLGAVAASPFGAGFGGSVWALVEEETASAFLDSWERRYRKAFPGREPDCFTTGAGPAVIRLEHPPRPR
jgi:galactokinase